MKLANYDTLYYDDDMEGIPDEAALALLIVVFAMIIYFLITSREAFSDGLIWILVISEILISIAIYFLFNKLKTEKEAEETREERTEYFLELDQVLKRRNR
jgi:hypothetical protein